MKQESQFDYNIRLRRSSVNLKHPTRKPKYNGRCKLRHPMEMSIPQAFFNLKPQNGIKPVRNICIISPWSIWPDLWSIRWRYYSFFENTRQTQVAESASLAVEFRPAMCSIRNSHWLRKAFSLGLISSSVAWIEPLPPPPPSPADPSLMTSSFCLLDFSESSRSDS